MFGFFYQRVRKVSFKYRRDLFSGLDLIFFDTTSIYFEGKGGQEIGKKGYSKDHRPDLNQMVVGAVIDEKGTPICCEIWPGNTADVKTLTPVAERLRNRFRIKQMCVVADRGMTSKATLSHFEGQVPPVPYILGARMKKMKEVRDHILSTGGRYKEVRSENNEPEAPSPLKVKEVIFNGKRYIVCLNSKQARKDALTGETIIESLREQLKKGPKKMIGNKVYRRYLKIERNSVSINQDKIKGESRYELQTNTDFSSEKVALKYKELWQVERGFRDVKSLLDTRPIYHQNDANIRGHVFCSFLALVLRKELERRLNNNGHDLEWAKIKQDLKALYYVKVEENGQRLDVRSRCEGDCANIFKAVGVAIPPSIK